jgi:TonB family protein
MDFGKEWLILSIVFYLLMLINMSLNKFLAICLFGLSGSFLNAQTCTVEFLGDRAVISYETSLGKGSNADLYYKKGSSSYWVKATNVTGDVGFLSKSQQRYIVIWDYKLECKDSPVEFVKVRVVSDNGLEQELSWQASDLPSISNVNSEKPKVFDFVQEEAHYPGGQEAMYAELRDYIVYPELEKTNGIEGTVYVSFIVEVDGTVSNVEVMRGVEEGPGFNKIAVGAVQKLKKAFIPATMNGNAVRYRMRIPVKFTLTSPTILKK